jgi:hypothetical protein
MIKNAILVRSTDCFCSLGFFSGVLKDLRGEPVTIRKARCLGTEKALGYDSRKQPSSTGGADWC